MVEYDFICMQPQGSGIKAKILFTVCDETTFQRLLGLPEAPVFFLEVNGPTKGFSTFHDLQCVIEQLADGRACRPPHL